MWNFFCYFHPFFCLMEKNSIYKEKLSRRWFPEAQKNPWKWRKNSLPSSQIIIISHAERWRVEEEEKFNFALQYFFRVDCFMLFKLRDDVDFVCQESEWKFVKYSFRDQKFKEQKYFLKNNLTITENRNKIF